MMPTKFSQHAPGLRRYWRSLISGTALAGALLVSVVPVPARAQISVSITLAPPELPVYDQPPIPNEGYIWTPGYWSWGPDGYYWVPGTWIEPPSEGLLWTPGYWGWGDGGYFFHAGYWGEHVGFYGGVNYGWGYGGDGYQGGYWDHGRFDYNRSVNNISNVHITNVYNRTVIVNNNTRVSYNGGAGGIHAQPSSADMAAAHERHISATSAQIRHMHAASRNRILLASVNHGHPAIAATAHPGVFHGHGVVADREAVRAGADHSAAKPRMVTPRAEHPTQSRAPETHATENAPAHAEERRAEPQPHPHSVAPEAEHAPQRVEQRAPERVEQAPQRVEHAPQRVEHAPPRQEHAPQHAEHAPEHKDEKK